MTNAHRTYVLAMLKEAGALKLIQQQTTKMAPLKALGKKPPAPVIRNVMK